MSRVKWATATAAEVERFVRDAREYAQRHRDGAVRMFVFSLCKGLERATRAPADRCSKCGRGRACWRIDCPKTEEGAAP